MNKMTDTASTGLTLDISFDQLIQALLRLPSSEKIQIANELRASAAAEQWRLLSQRLPDIPELGMDEILAEVKEVRKGRKRKTD